MDKIKLLANLPIYTTNIPIYSPLLKDIAIIGQEHYEMVLSCSTITKDRLFNSGGLQDDYDALIDIITKESAFLGNFIYGLFFFTKVEFSPQILDNEIAFVKDNIFINRSNYDSFVNYVKFANHLDVNIEEELKELDEFDRQVMEAEKKIQAAMYKDYERPNLANLISSVANFDGNDLNIINIWDLNIYQLYEQLHRGQLKEHYKWNLQQLLAGAKPEDIQLEPYVKNIK